MAERLSDALIKSWLDYTFGGTAYSGPGATIKFALMRTLPGPNGAGGVELSGSGYARVSVTNNSTNFPASTLGSGIKTNGAAIQFPAPTASWGTIAGIAMYDDAGTTLLGTFALSQTFETGQQPTIPAGTLTIQLTDAAA
jgi:hypothetical protein